MYYNVVNNRMLFKISIVLNQYLNIYYLVYSIKVSNHTCTYAVDLQLLQQWAE